jgi:hypothetical protein
MFEQFTVEEINLMGIFSTPPSRLGGDPGGAESRIALITELETALPDFDEPELIEITENVLAKLHKMSDADFDELELYPEYGEFDENGDYHEETEVMT